MLLNGSFSRLGLADRGSQAVSDRIAMGQPSAAALALAVPEKQRAEAMICRTQDGALWGWSAASTASDPTAQLVVTPDDGDGPVATGRWLRRDRRCTLKLPVGFATADAAVLFTVPVGFILRVGTALWEVSVAWTGGTNAAIGLSSSNASYNTKGDLLGGAGGDVLAGLTAGYRGTIGAKAASQGVIVLVAGDTIRFDRIADVFGAGAGYAHLPITQLT